MAALLSMGRMAKISRLLIFAGVLVAPPAISAGAQDGSCTMDRMEVSAISVIEPCTAVLQRSDLMPAQRGMLLFVRGRGYHRTGQFARAREDYDLALELIPANDELHVSRANIALRARRYDEGRLFLEEALKLNPKNPNALRTIGAVYRDMGMLDQALQYYGLALESDPAEPYTLYFRSQLYKRLKKFELALKDADRLVGIQPEVINRKGFLDHLGVMRDFHVMALVHRAGLLNATGKLEGAEQDLDRAVSRKSAEALVARGEFLGGRGRHQAALRDFDAALSIDPTNHAALYEKGMLLTRLRRYEDAFAAFDQVLKIDPEHAYALRMRARMRRERGETELAVIDFTLAMKLDPRIIAQSIPAFQFGGYWRSREVPKEITPELQDAIQGCMTDKMCN